MVVKARLSNREILEWLADNVDDVFTRIMVEARIGGFPSISQEDSRLIDSFVALVKQMEYEDFDNPHQSIRSRRLSAEFCELREKLLAQMSKKKHSQNAKV